MTVVRLSVGTLSQIPLDWQGNLKRILSSISKAETLGSHILMLPELCISGYGCEDAFFSPDCLTQALHSLQKIIEKSGDMAVLVGMPLLYQDLLYNSVVTVRDKKILGIQLKKRLPREGVHYESRWFSPWPPNQVETIEILSQKVPIGDFFYEFGDVGIAVEICEEAWGQVHDAEKFSDACSIILCPSASHFAFGKNELRKNLVSHASADFKVFYAYTNLIGLEAGKMIYDGSAFIAADGKIVQESSRFNLDEGDVISFPCGTKKIAQTKKATLASSKHKITVQSFTDKPAVENKVYWSGKIQTQKTLSENEEFLYAQELALRDYLIKSKADGYTISLSGGCDSSICALLVFRALKHVKKKSSFICVYQKTKQNSEKTEKLAIDLAKSLGATFYNVDVQMLVDEYVSTVETASKHKLDWEKDNFALQNIQARVRSPMAWLFANQTNSILISTGNRSEAGTGYTTMDGDSSGGVAPIAGVDKHFLRLWLKWYAETQCGADANLKSILLAVANQAPTAELKPLSDHQTDEKDLMPYDRLAFFEKKLFRDRFSFAQTLKEAQSKFSSAPKAELEEQLTRFITIFRRTQWKRERLAPAFHLDDMSFDAKTWLRYPIFSGDLTKD